MDNNNSRANQWLQHYESHQIQEMNPFFNTINMMSSSGSTFGDGGDGGDCGAVHEGVGRRSRATRRAVPTTLLNANPSNFRALVQKFTGRSATGDSNRRRGPVTLDFGSPTTISKETIFPVSRDQEHDQSLNQHVCSQQPHVTWSSTDATASYQLSEETNSAVYGGEYDDQDQDLVREYSGNSSYDGLDHMDYCQGLDNLDYYDGLEEFMMRDLDL